MLLNEFLKEHRKVGELEVTIAELKSAVAQQQKDIAAFTAALKAQAAQIQKVSDQLEASKPAPQVVNAIAAHKEELEKLLEDLLSDRVVSGIGSVAFLDAYITRLDTNCSDISARVNPPPAQISGELPWNQH